MAASTGLTHLKSCPQRGRTRILIIDGHPAIREVLSSVVESSMDLTLCGTAETLGEALRIISAKHPDVAVVDLNLRDASTLDVVQHLVTQQADLRVLVFSRYEERIYAKHALRVGASGYLMKSAPTQRVVEAVRCIMQGDVYFSPRMASYLLGKAVCGRTAGPSLAADEFTRPRRSRLPDVGGRVRCRRDRPS